MNGNRDMVFDVLMVEVMEFGGSNVRVRLGC